MDKTAYDFAEEAIVENPTSEHWVFTDKELLQFVSLIEQDIIRRILLGKYVR